SGTLTESIWREYRAIHMTPAGNPGQLARHANRLLNEQDEMKRLGAAGRALYEERFALRHTITALRSQTLDLAQVRRSFICRLAYSIKAASRAIAAIRYALCEKSRVSRMCGSFL